MNNKKIITGGLCALLIGGTAFGVFSENTSEKDSKRFEKLNLSDEEYLDFLKKKVSIKIDFTNSLIDALEIKQANATILKNQVQEYLELVTFLESVEISQTSKEDLKEAFFEVRKTKEERQEIKELIRNVFEKEEIKDLKETFREEKKDLREEFNLPKKKHKSWKKRNF